MTATASSIHWAIGVFVGSFACWTGANAQETTPPGIESFTSTLLESGRYLLDTADVPVVEAVNKRLREARSQREKGSEEQRAKASADAAAAARELIGLLEKNKHVLRVSIDATGVKPPHAGSLTLPGDAGAILLQIARGDGQRRFTTVRADLTVDAEADGVIEMEARAPATTWALVALTNAPVRRSSLMFSILDGAGGKTRLPLDVQSPGLARLKVRVLSADTGQPTPAMVRLTWKTMGMDRRPGNAIDLGPQFDSQGSPTGRRRVHVPGHKNQWYWCVPGPIDMQIPPGEWEMQVLRGAEHVVTTETFGIETGGLVEKSYTPRRWIDMRKLGWYSGDDHVHCRILSDDDARRLMAWVQAEDIHVANIVKMGDINRTWFEQRGWGKEYRVIEGDTILSPGQECPRTHQQLGHTLSMNTQGMVRDTDRYYIYEEVADAVHRQGGLWGYAHVCSKIFNVDRDMSINIPKDKCDFVELIQFGDLGTELYYDFLNTGFKMTASAGSDVPWGGSVGEVRVYAYTGDQAFTADAWFEAVRRGRTFATSGPMIDFRVDEALPGDEIVIKENRRLRVKARAWGDPDRIAPAALEIVRHGEVIKSAESSDPRNKELAVDFEVDSGNGFWMAARVRGANGAVAHTTPVYVVREGLRFWKLEDIDRLIARRLASLAEVEKIVADARRRNDAGELRTDRAWQQLAIQGPELLEKVKGARELYEGLKGVAERERAARRRQN